MSFIQHFKIHNTLDVYVVHLKHPSNMFSKKTPLVEPKASLLTEDEKREFRGIDFPFENLALEGGGGKGLAYIGVVRVSF